ncbi:MAG: hypothetical protein GX763_07650 [Clostridiaceae bacterium]|nr:hypothetical protein [Clostridiaceae bacterium]
MASKSRTKKSKAKKTDAGRFRSFMRNPAGIWTAVILSAALLLILNSLIAGKSLEIFLGLTAFEMLVSAAVIWVILLRRRTK